jgi:hypothetical protein
MNRFPFFIVVLVLLTAEGLPGFGQTNARTNR